MKEAKQRKAHSPGFKATVGLVALGGRQPLFAASRCPSRPRVEAPA